MSRILTHPALLLAAFTFSRIWGFILAWINGFTLSQVRVFSSILSQHGCTQNQATPLSHTNRSMRELKTQEQRCLPPFQHKVQHLGAISHLPSVLYNFSCWWPSVQPSAPHTSCSHFHSLPLGTAIRMGTPGRSSSPLFLSAKLVCGTWAVLPFPCTVIVDFQVKPTTS